MRDDKVDHLAKQNPPDGKAVGNSGGEYPDVTLRWHTARTALSAAEQAADEMTELLRAAEQERDAAVRRLGDAQRQVDVLEDAREHRSRHVRDLLAAVTVNG